MDTEKSDNNIAHEDSFLKVRSGKDFLIEKNHEVSGPHQRKTLVN